jgi:type VI secretion system protein ImpE
MSETVEAALARGDLDAAMRSVMDEVRTAPAALGPRMALFQLAAVAGDWDRARRQLDTIARLDPEAAMMAQAYGAAIDAEATRRAVFAGRERPVCLGEPPAFVAMLAEALLLDAQGEGGAAGALRRQALEAAEPVEGTLNGTPFAWIMDADTRLGPVLEAVVQGQYRWLPFSSMRELRAEPPKDQKDLIWAAVRVTLANGGELPEFVPVRYPGSEASPDAALRLARATAWQDAAGGQRGLGQRLLAADTADHPFLELRRLRLETGHG